MLLEIKDDVMENWYDNDKILGKEEVGRTVGSSGWEIHICLEMQSVL